MLFLREDTAVTVMIGPFVDATDGATAEIALTITSAEVFLSKNGGAFAAKHEGTALTHDEAHNGFYTCPLDTTDTNTAGVLILAINESGALPVWAEFMIMPTQVWDSFFSTDLLQVHAAEISNGLITAAAIANGAIDAATFAAGAIDAGALAADAVDEILDEVVEGTLTLRHVLKVLLAVCAGKSSGGGTSTAVFRDNADLKPRMTATVDASGNRTAVTLDGA